jgi:outer membrane protein assembly factor BamB
MWGRWISVSKVVVLIVVLFLMLVSAPLVSLGQVSASTSNNVADLWPMEGGNPQQSGLTNQNITTGDNTSSWNVTLGGGTGALPAIGTDGTVYVACWNSQLYAIDPNGSVKWNKTVLEYNPQSPAVSDRGIIYLPSDGKNSTMLYAIDRNGTTLWQHDPEDHVPDLTAGIDFTSPAILTGNGTVLVKASVSYQNSSCLFAYGPSGSFLWSAKVNGLLYTPAVGPEGNIYVASSLGALYAFNSTGYQLWSMDLGLGRSTLSVLPAVGPDGTVYFVLRFLDDRSNATLFSVTPRGTINWEFKPFGSETGLNESPISRPAIDRNGTIYLNIGAAEDGYGRNYAALEAVSPDGKMKWSCKIPEVTSRAQFINSGISNLVIDGQGKVMGVTGNRVFAVWTNGSLQGLYSTPGFFYGMVVGLNGSSYFLENGDNQVETLWAYAGIPTSPVVPPSIFDWNTAFALVIIAPVIVVSIVVVVLLRRERP